MAIQLTAYEAAVKYLIKAGSRTAKKVHIPHGPGSGSVKKSYGVELLRNARDDFDAQQGGQNVAGRAAVVHAAGLMGITEW